MMTRKGQNTASQQVTDRRAKRIRYIVIWLIIFGLLIAVMVILSQFGSPRNRLDATSTATLLEEPQPDPEPDPEAELVTFATNAAVPELIITAAPIAEVKWGQTVTVEARTKPGVQCDIHLSYKLPIPAEERNLMQKKANEYGLVSWTWMIWENTPLGKQAATITCNNQWKNTAEFRIEKE